MLLIKDRRISLRDIVRSIQGAAASHAAPNVCVIRLSQATLCQPLQHGWADMKKLGLRMVAGVILLIAGLFVSGDEAVAAETSACAPTDAAMQISATVRGLYAAAASEDMASWVKLTSPDFFAYDIGQRFNGTGLFDFIKAAHKAGRKFEWNIEDMEIHFDCNWAWTNHVNRGSVTDANGTQPVSWVESAVLTWRQGEWRVVFMHSTRAPPQK